MSEYTNKTSASPLTVEGVKAAIEELEKLRDSSPMLISQGPLFVNIPDPIVKRLERNRKMNARKNKRRRWRDAHKGTVVRWP